MYLCYYLHVSAQYILVSENRVQLSTQTGTYKNCKNQNVQFWVRFRPNMIRLYLIIYFVITTNADKCSSQNIRYVCVANITTNNILVYYLYIYKYFKQICLFCISFQLWKFSRPVNALSFFLKQFEISIFQNLLPILFRGSNVS